MPHLAPLVASAALFLLLTVPGLRAYDALAFLVINTRPVPSALEVLLRLISHLGLFPTNVLVWAALPLLSDREDKVLISLVGGAGMVATWVACRVGKHFIARPRPFISVDGARLVGLTPSGSSFPSSHSALAFYSAATLAQLFDWPGGWVLAGYGLALLVAYVRIYLGAHFPRDVLAGIVLGLAMSLGAVAVLDQIGRGQIP